jgi:DNA topoisomerase-2
MPIWSLTQERVDKITKQVGDKEMEIDELTKLSSKDLWNRDLDDFINEWHLQLDDERKRAKKIAGISRRASAKLGIGIKGAKKSKKRKAGSDFDDSGSDADFAVPKKKPAVKAVMDRVKPKGASTLMSFFQQPESQPLNAPKDSVPGPAAAKPTTATASKAKPQTIASDDDDFMDIDNFHVEKEVVAVKKGKAAAPKAKSKTILSDDDDEDIFAAVAQEAKAKKASEAPPSRAGRIKKPTKYIISDESDDSFGEDQADPGDLSMMVKGIGAGTAELARPLFSTTAQRPTSSHGLQKIMQKSKSKSVESEDEIDDTNYEGLIPQDSPRRPAPRTANETFVSDGEDENDFPVTKPANKAKTKTSGISKITAKPAAKTVAKKPAVKKAAPAAVVKKPMLPSPAAKAYAAKQARLQAQSKLPLKKNASETESEDEEANNIANELLGDSDEEMEDAPVVARPGRRAASAAAAKTKKYVIDEDDDSDEASEDDSFGNDDDESD